MAVDGQACTQASQESHAERSMAIPASVVARAPLMQASMQLRQPMHLLFSQWICTMGETLSGL
jgi:hypothetical protein